MYNQQGILKGTMSDGSCYCIIPLSQDASKVQISYSRDGILLNKFLSGVTNYATIGNELVHSNIIDSRLFTIQRRSELLSKRFMDLYKGYLHFDSPNPVFNLNNSLKSLDIERANIILTVLELY